MAFAKGQESKESVIKRYVGVAPVFIKAINPSKADLEKLYNTVVEKEPEYVSTTDVNGEQVPQVRLDFIISTNPEKTGGISLTSKMTFFITKTPWINQAGTKVQMVNRFGEFFWITLEEAEKKEITTTQVYRSTEGRRVAYRGEEELTEFLKNYLVIPSPQYMDRNTGEWKPIKNLEDAEAQLGHVEDYFKGNFSELRDIIASQPNNQVKVCFGVKTTSENKQYQDVFTRMTLRLRATDYSKLDERIQNVKLNGGYSQTEFSVEPLHEYTIEATTFSPNTTASPAPNPSNWFNK